MSGDPGLAGRLDDVRTRVSDAAASVGRSANDITLIVVTKFHTSDLVRELHALGVRDFGESRHQESEPKVAELADLSATWHFVGQLQSNKARQIARYIDVLHSLDRDSLLKPLRDVPLDVFIEVDLSSQPGRGGAQPRDVPSLAESVGAQPSLRLLGLMAVAPLGQPPRGSFATLKALSLTLQQRFPGASALSMGMSGDFEEAVLEGATHLRIGTAITGNRPSSL